MTVLVRGRERASPTEGSGHLLYSQVYLLRQMYLGHVDPDGGRGQPDGSAWPSIVSRSFRALTLSGRGSRTEHQRGGEIVLHGGCHRMPKRGVPEGHNAATPRPPAESFDCGAAPPRLRRASPDLACGSGRTAPMAELLREPLQAGL